MLFALHCQDCPEEITQIHIRWPRSFGSGGNRWDYIIREIKVLPEWISRVVGVLFRFDSVQLPAKWCIEILQAEILLLNGKEQSKKKKKQENISKALDFGRICVGT